MISHGQEAYPVKSQTEQIVQNDSTLVVSMHKRTGGGGGGGQTELILVRGRRLLVRVPANALAHRLLN